jgi:hypothetical protein
VKETFNDTGNVSLNGPIDYIREPEDTKKGNQESPHLSSQMQAHNSQLSLLDKEKNKVMSRNNSSKSFVVQKGIAYDDASVYQGRSDQVISSNNHVRRSSSEDRSFLSPNAFSTSQTAGADGEKRGRRTFGLNLRLNQRNGHSDLQRKELNQSELLELKGETARGE